MEYTCKSCSLTMDIPDHLAGREVNCRGCKELFVVPDTRPCPYCAETIKTAARVCRHCNRSLESTELPEVSVSAKESTRSVSPLTAVIVVAFAVLVVWFVVVQRPSRSTATPDGRYVMPQSVAAPPPVVTQAEYNQLAEGMTYDQVAGIIGASGEELSRSDLAGISTVMYQWVNSNGSNMNAMFQNGAMVQKAQFGLP